jgi:hypothetical protein
MPYFRVATDGLIQAAALVRTSDTELSTGRGAVAGLSGACAGTLAAGGCDALVTSIDNVVSSVSGAVSDLQNALQTAAISYQAADSTAAQAVSVKGG